jgi:ABC-type transport system substrate-binding protein
MIDAPGPWGTGPFMLVEGHSLIDIAQAVVDPEPFAATWLWREQRTPRLRLAANPGYRDTARGPHLREVVFRNDLPPERALELVCTTEGEVDIVTEVSPADAERVGRSEHARLVAVNGMRAVAGVINRDAEGLPLRDRRARQALNLAIDRRRLVREAMVGRARPLAGLTPPTMLTALHRFPDRLTPSRTTPPARPGCGVRPAARGIARSASPLRTSWSASRTGPPRTSGSRSASLPRSPSTAVRRC